jgi:hypothetical protein
MAAATGIDRRMDVMNPLEEKIYTKEALQRAQKMVAALESNTNPREIFFAAILIAGWAMGSQSEEIQKQAINMAMDIFKGSSDLFARYSTPPLKMN